MRAHLADQKLSLDDYTFAGLFYCTVGSFLIYGF